MTCLPYPTFLNAHTSTPEIVNLSAVGRVRIFPLTCPGRLPLLVGGNNDTPRLPSAPEEYRTIVSKLTTTTTTDDVQQEQQLIKTCNKLTQNYICQTLGIDVSIIDVEIVLDISTITNTHGRIATCFLNAGCAYIVIPVDDNEYDEEKNNHDNDDDYDNRMNYNLNMALNACNITLLPREHLILHLKCCTSFGQRKGLLPSPQQLHDIENSVGTISLQYTLADVDRVAAATAMIPLLCNNESKTKLIITLITTTTPIKEGLTTTTTTIDEDEDEEEEHTNNLGTSIESNIHKPTTTMKMTKLCVYPPAVLTAIQTLSQIIGQCQNNNNLKCNITLLDPSPAQLGSAYISCLTTDRSDKLYPTVVCTRNNEALGLVYSNVESIIAALTCGQGVYYSRSRASLWHKGKTSGHAQTLHRIDADCDGDAIRFTVTQSGHGFCHLNTLSCWGEPRGLRQLENTLTQRLLNHAPEGSYTKRLFNDHTLLRNKLVEEAQELSEAVTKDHVTEELADVLYFALVRAVKAGVSIDDAAAELDRRARKVTRRPGDSKEYRIKAGEEILGKSKK